MIVQVWGLFFEDYFFSKRLDLIGVSAFHRCDLVQSINIPRYVRVIEKGAFESCHGLMTADLGKGLEIIGAGMFNACSSLHHVNIPGGVRSIQNWAFSYCSRLTTLVLNIGHRVIEKFAFTYCISLECIVVPPTVREIEQEAFLQCEQLSLVILQTGLEIIGSGAFSGTSIKTITKPPLFYRNLGWCFWALFKFDTGGVRGCTGEFYKTKIFSNTFSSHCNLVDMVCCMNIHQEICWKKYFAMSETCFFVFFLNLLASMQCWWVFFLFCLLVGHPNPHRLHPTSISYIYKVF